MRDGIDCEMACHSAGKRKRRMIRHQARDRSANYRMRAKNHCGALRASGQFRVLL